MQLTLKETTLRELVEAQSVRAACVVGLKGGYAVTVRYGLIERTLATTRGEVRVFASLNTAADFLRKLGLAKFEVDATGYEPGRVRPARPDRAEALRKTRTKLKQAELL
jgi:hypothetical protein